MSEAKIGIVILAAGASRRLGQPKQLVKFRGKSLLQVVIDEVGNTEAACKWIVLGANRESIEKEIDFRPVNIIFNRKWEEGMASSIRNAVDRAEKEDLDGLLVVLSDQPYVTSELLDQLIRFYRPGEELIMASEYNHILGVPALFDRVYYKELMKLSGDHGARKLINAFRAKVKSVKFEEGIWDVDTPADLEKLNKREDANNG